jgi:hypothetical protein
MNRLTELRRQAIASKPKEELLEMAIKPHLQGLMAAEEERVSAAAYIQVCVRDGENIDIPYFESIDDVMDLPDELKQYFADAIRQVHLIRGGFDIKNSQGRSVTLIGPAENTPEATEESSTKDSSDSPSPKKKSRGGRKR